MRAINIFLKTLSLFISAFDIYVFYLLNEHEKAHRFGEPLWGEQGEFVLTAVGAIVLVGLPMVLIWFGKYISEFAEQRAEWAPTGMIIFAGWISLLIPATLFILYKMKIISV